MSSDLWCIPKRMPMPILMGIPVATWLTRI